MKIKIPRHKPYNTKPHISFDKITERFKNHYVHMSKEKFSLLVMNEVWNSVSVFWLSEMVEMRWEMRWALTRMMAF